MKWKTAISTIEGGEEIIRGKKLTDMIVSGWSFSKSIFFLLQGEEPTDNQTKMMDALLTAAIDHGIGTPSTMTARTVVSTKNSMHTSVAAGLLAMGELHGSAIEGAARFFSEHVEEDDIPELVRQLKEQKVRIPGFGHPVLEEDHRSGVLFAKARDVGIYGKHCEVAEKIYVALNEILSKKLPLNIDGSMAAIMLDLGFDWRLAKGFFMMARVPGLVAHVHEEQMQKNGIRRLSLDDAEYIA